MMHTTDYYEQAKGQTILHNNDLMILRLTDTSTLLREYGKWNAAVGFVSCVACVVFDFDLTSALTVTAIGGATWLCFTQVARRLEPEAKNIIDTRGAEFMRQCFISQRYDGKFVRK